MQLRRLTTLRAHRHRCREDPLGVCLQAPLLASPSHSRASSSPPSTSLAAKNTRATRKLFSASSGERTRDFRLRSGLGIDVELAGQSLLAKAECPGNLVECFRGDAFSDRFHLLQGGMAAIAARRAETDFGREELP